MFGSFDLDKSVEVSLNKSCQNDQYLHRLLTNNKERVQRAMNGVKDVECLNGLTVVGVNKLQKEIKELKDLPEK